MLKLFAPFGAIFGWIMYAIYNVVHNYGITLILFTLLIRLLMVPLGIRQQKSLIANARMQPKLAALQKMYGNNRERYSAELQKLYTEEHFSPWSSCLPTLLMFPVLFGVLDVVYYPLKHMLHMSEADRTIAVSIAEQVLGEGNLNRYSREISVLNAVKLDPQAFLDGLGADLTAKMQTFDFTMFGLPLGEQPSIRPEGKSTGLWLALLLIPILSAVSAYVMGKLSSSNTQSLNASDSATSMSNAMRLMMPLMSLWISFIVPAGVGIYWLLSNVFSLIQQVFLNKYMNPAEEIAKAQAFAEEQKALERQERIEAKKRAKEALARGEKDLENLPQKEQDRLKIAEARRRMAEKYGEEVKPDDAK